MPDAPTGWPPPISPPLGLMRQPSANLDFAVFDGLPRFTRAGKTDVVDRQILTGSKAVVHLDPVHIVEARLCASQRVERGRPHMRHDVWGRLPSGRAVELLLQAQSDGAMPPACDSRDRPSVRMIAQVFVCDQDDSRSAVGHLAAVESAQSAFDERIGRVVVGDRTGHGPFSGLRVGVSACVAEVDLRDRPQMGFVQSVAAVVLVGDGGEHRRPEVFRIRPFVSGPGRGAEMARRGVAVDGLLEFDAENQRGVVIAGPQVGHRRQRGHASRRAGSLVP